MLSTGAVISVLGGLGLFLYGMKVMSESLQKVAGYRLRIALKKITNNRFSGILTGFMVTSAIQSSSATTVMLVSFVNAGLMDLTQSIGVIMGANIGTTVTGWIVAILGFKIKITAFALPAIALGFFIRFLGKQRLTDWGESLLGFGLLFLGLTLMKDALGDLRKSQEIFNLMGRFRAEGLFSTIAVVFVGTIVTFVIQSSSATMALTMTLAGQGLIDFPTCAALILGENIGTTITANIAAIGASTAAKRSARAHMVFNVIGVIWMMVFFGYFLKFVDYLVPGDVFSQDIKIASSAVPDHMAAFHSLFNIINTALFIPLVGILGWIATRMVKPPAIKEENRLVYISSGLVSTPPMAIEASKRELQRMASTVHEMLNEVMRLFNTPEPKAADYEKYKEKITKLETLTDNLEKGISHFLVNVIRNTTSEAQSEEIAEIMNATSNLERIGDHCESLLKLTMRMEEKELKFTQEAVSEIDDIADRARSFLALIEKKIILRRSDIMEKADNFENDINCLRTKMRKSHVDRLNEGSCNVDAGLIFIDMLTSFEKIGDHAYNIAQFISGVR